MELKNEVKRLKKILKGTDDLYLDLRYEYINLLEWLINIDGYDDFTKAKQDKIKNKRNYIYSSTNKYKSNLEIKK